MSQRMSKKNSSSSRWNIYHKTEIDAPIEKTWNALLDIKHWDWNKWTKLEANKVSTGTKGKLKASYDGNDVWKTFDFTFDEVNSKHYILSWFGDVGPSGCLFSGYHTMQLEKGGPDADEKTILIHHERFNGLLPALGLGLPYKKLDRNYRFMNEEFKKFVENSVTST